MMCQRASTSELNPENVGKFHWGDPACGDQTAKSQSPQQVQNEAAFHLRFSFPPHPLSVN